MYGIGLKIYFIPKSDATLESQKTQFYLIGLMTKDIDRKIYVQSQMLEDEGLKAEVRS